MLFSLGREFYYLGIQTRWGSRGLLLPGGGFLYHILSLNSLVPNSIRGPEDPFCRVVAFSAASSLQLVWSPTHWLLVIPELYNSSIAHSISLHNLLSEKCHFQCLWDGMFDCHRAEITVIQFRGHSLPVHQSMNVSWAFTLSHFVSQIRLRDFFRLLAIGMCHFLPVHHFGMAFLAGSMQFGAIWRDAASRLNKSYLYHALPEDATQLREKNIYYTLILTQRLWRWLHFLKLYYKLYCNRKNGLRLSKLQGHL